MISISRCAWIMLAVGFIQPPAEATCLNPVAVTCTFGDVDNFTGPDPSYPSLALLSSLPACPSITRFDERPAYPCESIENGYFANTMLGCWPANQPICSASITIVLMILPGEYLPTDSYPLSLYDGGLLLWSRDVALLATPVNDVYTITLDLKALPTPTGPVDISNSLLDGELSVMVETFGVDYISMTVTDDSYLCLTPPPGMVAWWPLDERESRVSLDAVGYSHGSRVGDPTPATGKVAGALRFTSAGDFVQVADYPALDFGTGSFSLDAWIRTSDTTGADRTIVGKRGGTISNPQGYVLGVHGDGNLVFQVGDGRLFSGNHLASGPVLTDGVWHHVAAVADRSGAFGVVTLYVDGVMRPLQTNNNVNMDNITNTSPLLIGQRNVAFGQENPFIGDIDEVELFNRVLTAQEISSIHNAGSLGKCKPLNYAPIPTLSEWGMVVLTVLLGSVGALLVRRRRLERTREG